MLDTSPDVHLPDIDVRSDSEQPFQYIEHDELPELQDSSPVSRDPAGFSLRDARNVCESPSMQGEDVPGPVGDVARKFYGASSGTYT